MHSPAIYIASKCNNHVGDLDAGNWTTYLVAWVEPLLGFAFSGHSCTFGLGTSSFGLHHMLHILHFSDTEEMAM